MLDRYNRSHLDASVLTFNYDAIVDPRLKDGCCKKVPWQEYMALSAADMRYSSYHSYCPYPPELLLLLLFLPLVLLLCLSVHHVDQLSRLKLDDKKKAVRNNKAVATTNRPYVPIEKPVGIPGLSAYKTMPLHDEGSYLLHGSTDGAATNAINHGSTTASTTTAATTTTASIPPSMTNELSKFRLLQLVRPLTSWIQLDVTGAPTLQLKFITDTAAIIL